jgi:hypothetical protein
MRAGLLSLVATGSLLGCSLTAPGPRQPVTAATRCSMQHVVADTVIGAGLIGAAAGSIPYVAETDSTTATIAVASTLVVAGAVFLVSSGRGFAATERCHREVLAATPAAPLHFVESTAPRTCVQRRLDMYSRAITGADPEQRSRLLATLPACDEEPERERAWELTRTASLAAAAGECDDIERMARQVYDLDVPLHDVVLLSDIEVKHCLQRREL